MRNPSRFFIITIYLLVITGCEWKSSQIYQHNISSDKFSQTLIGLDVLELSNFELIRDKSVGLVVNHTSVNRSGEHIIDLLSKRDDIVVKIIFAPEHGYEGKLSAGESISDNIEPKTGARIVSLYGKNKSPKAVEIQDLDCIVFDIQDIGARYYTYTSTMTNVMQSAGENGIEVIVLDRINPLNGVDVQGPILNSDFYSFVGKHQIPIRHGMTIGELAVMINESEWLYNSNCQLNIVPIVNWSREMDWKHTKLKWIPPSPNIPNYETAFIYLGMCLLEGTNVSEGRGTDKPFLQFGAPWINSEELMLKLKEQISDGISLNSVEFIPKSIPQAKYPKYENQICYGIEIHIENFEINPINVGVRIIDAINDLYPVEFEFLDSSFIDKLYGSDEFRRTIEDNQNIDSLIHKWTQNEKDFESLREKFLLKKYQ